jgi:DNA-3-methyladenine glycosylase I
MIERCKWVNEQNKLYLHYHDKEWGVPVHDDNILFEMLILEGAQAGLSWETVLKKRENYRKAFKNFDPQKASEFNEKDIEKLLQNEGIIRNRLKITSAVNNAKIFLEIQKEHGSFDHFIWSYVNNTPINKGRKTIDEIPARDETSDKISKDLKKRGMSFIGSTIMYAYMQSIGMINDHTTNCFRYKELISNEGDAVRL